MERRERDVGRVLRCPECGYEVGAAGAGGARLAGGARTDRGLCSECGREFVWSELESPSVREIAWFIEHRAGEREGEGMGRGGLRLTGKAIATCWRVITLGVWREVTLGARVSVVRMLAWWLIVIGGMHVVASVLSMGRVVWLLRGSWGPGAPAGSLTTLGLAQQVATCFVYPVIEGFDWWAGGARSLSALAMWSYMGWPTEVIAAIVGHVAAGVVAMALVSSRRAMGVGGVHVLRAWVYGWAWLVALAGFRAVRNVVVLVGVVWDRAVGTAASGGSGGSGWVQVRFGGMRPLYVSELPVGVLWAITCGWLAAWWFVTVRQGWEAERPVRLWLAIAVPGALAGGAAAVWRDGYYWYW